MDQLLQIFWIFIKVNLLSTSGPASVGLLYHEVVGKLISEAQFVQAVGLSSVLPGSDALQLAMYIGYAVAGIPGGFVALTASILPPTIIILGVTMILHRLRREAWIGNFVEGLAPAISVLMLFTGMSYQEIADATDVPIGTVRSRLARGRAILRRKLESYARKEGYLKEESYE